MFVVLMRLDEGALCHLVCHFFMERMTPRALVDPVCSRWENGQERSQLPLGRGHRHSEGTV